MSFFFGGNERAVPVLVKHIERLFRGGRLNEVGLVVVGCGCCCCWWWWWCRLDPVTTAASSWGAAGGGGDGGTGRASSAAERSVAYLGGSSWLIHDSCV